MYFAWELICACVTQEPGSARYCCVAETITLCLTMSNSIKHSTGGRVFKLPLLFRAKNRSHQNWEEGEKRRRTGELGGILKWRMQGGLRDLTDLTTNGMGYTFHPRCELSFLSLMWNFVVHTHWFDPMFLLAIWGHLFKPTSFKVEDHLQEIFIMYLRDHCKYP